MRKFFVRLYRKYYDFPIHWKPYGWTKDEMTEWYWMGGECIPSENNRSRK